MRDNEHRTTSAATTKTSRADIVSLDTIVGGTVTTTPSTHPHLVMAMLSFAADAMKRVVCQVASMVAVAT